MALSKIGTAGIGAGAITANTVLSTGVITADLIATGNVGTSEIANLSITDSKITSNAVTSAKIRGNAVGAIQLNANAVVGDIASSNGVFTHNTHTYQKAQSGRVESVTVGAANVQLNFANANIFNLTLNINTHLNLPSNPTVGQGGSIIVTQDGTGSRTLSYAGAWEFPGGTAPTLTTTANAQDRIDYLVVAANAIHAVASLNVT